MDASPFCHVRREGFRLPDPVNAWDRAIIPRISSSGIEPSSTTLIQWVLFMW